MIVLFILFGTLNSNAQPGDTIYISEDIQLIQLKDSIFMHKTWIAGQGGGRFSANGMIVMKSGKAVMIDTPVNDDLTRELTAYLKSDMGVELTQLIIGHFHIDCMGGLPYIQEEGIESIACSLTIDTCKQLRLPIPSTSFKDQYKIDYHGLELVCRHFGGGHTFDNITVWIPSQKILFGGCLVKETAQVNLYDLTEEEADEWQETITRIIDSYPDVQIVVPGHGAAGGIEYLKHTIDLAEKNRVR
ncbi:subclass B1 metallo-beta-lactamase [Bacteroidota bacterium]